MLPRLSLDQPEPAPFAQNAPGEYQVYPQFISIKNSGIYRFHTLGANHYKKILSFKLFKYNRKLADISHNIAIRLRCRSL